MKRWLGPFVSVVVLLVPVLPVYAQKDEAPSRPIARQVAGNDLAPPKPGENRMLPPRPLSAPVHHGASAPTTAGHDNGHEGGHEAGSINWIYGLLGERKDVVEPTLWFRPIGMPVPFLASVFNLAVLIGLGVFYGRKPLAAALVRRRELLVREIEEASRMKVAAKKRLRFYEKKLARVGHERTRLEQLQRVQLDQEKDKASREAEEKRARLRQDVDLMLHQERAVAHAHLVQRVVEAAAAQAEQLVRDQLSAADQQRLAEEYLRHVMTSDTTFSTMSGMAGVRTLGSKA